MRNTFLSIISAAHCMKMGEGDVEPYNSNGDQKSICLFFSIYEILANQIIIIN